MRSLERRWPALASVPREELAVLPTPAVHAAGLSVSTIFQASSESSIGFTLPAGEAGPAVAALRRAFKEELSAGLIDDVASRADVAVIAVVGEGMAGTPGIAARVFTALARAGLNVIAVAQGSSERNISFVVRSDQAGEAALTRPLRRGCDAHPQGCRERSRRPPRR